MSINLKPEHANHSTSLTMDALNLNETCRQIAEMKSIQPYSTKDEYIYAMKEDLADWFNSMYATNLTANNFIDQLKNGVLICEHANNVMREAAFKSFAFRMFDLQQAGIININQLTITNNQNNSNVGNSKTNIKNLNYRSNTPTLNLKMPNGQSAFAGEYLMYNQEPKMIMIAYDNITNFIRWCRFIVKVKECLMFETEDLTLCKNEKNFILCLLEVARFGSKFGIRVPTIIQLEQEIEAEMELDKTANMISNKNEDSHFSLSKNRFIEEKQPNKEYIKSLGQNDDISSNESKSPSPSPPPPAVALTMPPEIMHEIIEPSSNNYFLNDEILTSSFSSISNSPSIDKLKDHMIHSPISSSRSNSPMNKFLKNNNEQDDDAEQKSSSQSQNINNSDLFINNNFSPSESLSSPRSSLTSLTSSINQARDMADRTYESNDMDIKSPISPISSDFSSHLPIIKNSPETYLAKKSSAEKINFHSLIPNRIETKQKIASSKSPNKASKLPSRVNSTENLLESKPSSVAMSNHLINTESVITTVTTQQHQQVNLHKHVCSIANKCTCEKKFLVDKIGEGKYRIGNTKNIVFIRILKNHIMVRVGGGWDTLENYLDKHDPCRCSSSIDSVSNSNKRYNETNVNAEYSSQQQSSNIILTPVKPTASSNSNHSGNQTGSHNSSSKGVIRVTTINCNNNSNNNNSSSNKLNSPITPNSDTIVKSKSNSNINFVNNNNNLLKALSPSNINSCSFANNSNNNNNNNNSYLTYESETKRAIDFTDAHLIIERDNQGKHQIGKILLPSSTHSQLHQQQQHQHIQQVIHSTSANFLKYNNNNNNNNNNQTNNKDGLEEQYINNNDTMHSSRNIYFLNALKHASQSQSNTEQENKNAFNLNINNNSNSNSSNSNGIGSRSILFNNNDSNNNLSPSINSSESLYSANNKAESLIKNKMKKFINRIPQTVTSCSSSSYSCSNSNSDSNFISSSFKQQASPSSTYSGLRKSASSNSSSPDPLSPSNQQSTSSNSPVSFRRTPIEQQLQNTSAGLLKFTRTNFIDQMHNNQKQLQSQQIQTHHSLRVNNLDSGDHLLDTPVYTETKLPPRILRKYQKERSITEAQIVSPQQPTEEKHRVLHYENEMKSSDIDCSSSSCGSALGSSLISGGTTSPSSKIISYNTNRNGIILSSGDPIHSSSSTETASSTSSSYQSSCLSYNESSSKQIANTNPNNLDVCVSRKQQTQSPKLAVKLKGKLKKYKKSKTTDLAKYGADGEQLDELDDEHGLEETNAKPNSNTSSDLVNSDFDSLESDSICCEPTADNISSQTNSNLLLRFVSPSPILKAHQNKPTHELENLNDSLELVSTPTENEETKKLNDFFIQMNENDNRIGLEDDSLLINDSPQPSEPSSEPMKILSKPNRAQWDKSRQQIDLMYFNFSKLNNKQEQTKSNNQPLFKKPIKSQPKPQPQQQPAIENSAFNRKESHNRSHSQAAVSQMPNPSNTATLPSNLKTKRVKNLNLAKEKLYEMKKTIDAKVNLDIVNSKPTRFAATNSANVKISPPKMTANQHQHQNQYQQPTTNTRTTPRKVKKRSGERSLTTGIIASENNFLNIKNISASKSNGLASLKSNAMMCASNTSINSVCTNFSINTVNNNNNSYCKIQSNKLRSRTPNQLSSSSLSRLHKTSASLHNISNCNNNTNNTYELMDTNEASINVNCVARNIRNRHDSFSSTASSYFGLSGNANDYKENKAYELRKKSTLMNKIITKNQNQDPIYSRSHPIRSELVDQKVLDINNITLGSLGCSYEQKHSAARKRLFTKKNEKTGGFDPNVSIGSNASSSTTSTSTTTTSHNKFNSIISPVNTMPRQSRTANKNGQIAKSNKPLTPRSKSNNDLYYELERTNSAQDLIELLNNCDAPAGDLNQYKIMLSECEKLQFHINKLKTQHKIQKTKCNPPIVTIKKSPTSIPNRIKSIANEQKSSRQQAQLKCKYSLQNELNKSSLGVVEQTQINKDKNEQDLVNQEKDKELFENRNNNENLNESSLTNSMHRRSHSLPSYMAIPVPTSVSRQK